ncbi:baseplate J/gp47 family protein [Acinetobacter ursingii]|uniref:Baseplate J/gp47 family protein n=1 Tax=Acinetobacter ursingii TaxID=108980 RepID=A0A7T9Z6L4_9GAMM|nr:baseplate J/gp47 family protein [Acinetobacter ursingii]ENX48755.1 hypothetical protein F943_02292 [Acinetobacter ursingii NIPH 706]MCH2014709.1 baseplate J/gp47 family protein [Acinetobacter ursingii]MCU4522577.1 baseplate J/gp47 family protein [Acinetobacter ursingii]MCU4587402.1 baseplate J/gp47 family protein [Acinetobacter ursingii]QQT85826.1 baseplate J/gp47 family protein [Acinetobacter ursingii]
MAYPIPNFNTLYRLIVQEIRNQSGLSISDDSDAGIRAAGTASTVEGLYHHQTYIQRQLFISTADEPFLYVHAEEIGLPRLGGTKASGTVTATANVDMTILAGTHLTNGKGYYWSVATDVELIANTAAVVNVVAGEAGTSWNSTDASLMWVSPAAGLSGNVQVISISGGSDEEELEDWRSRLSERKKLGDFKDRRTDLIFMMKSVTGVEHVYIYPKRRGLGSLDIGITAKGNPPTLPSAALIASAQQVLDDYLGILADSRVFSPTQQLVDVTAVLSGTTIDLVAAQQMIRDYFAELEPADSYLPAILSARLLNLSNVTDVQLTPDYNITPTVDWMNLFWLRAGNVIVSKA